MTDHARIHRRLPPASRTLLLIVAACAGAACERGDDRNAYVPPPPPEVVVEHPVEREVVSYLTYTGVVEASERVELRARVQGFLAKINFQPGQRVRAGDVLFEIDPRTYAAAVDQAAAAVKAAEASLLGAENDARLARELADQRAGPEIDAIIKAARRDTLRAEVERARANLVDAQLNLEFCTVVAPIDGRIGRNFVDVGNLVGRGEPTVLAEIVQNIPVYVPVDISESDVLKVRRARVEAGETELEPGQVAPGEWRACELALADQADFAVRGRIDYVEPQVNADTGTLRVRTRFENENDQLLPGFFARLRFPMSTSKAIVVPEAALLSDQQGRFALVVNGSDEVEVRRVRTGVLDGTGRVIEEGLTPADRVITLGVLKARPGAKVTPKTTEAAPTRR